MKHTQGEWERRRTSTSDRVVAVREAKEFFKYPSGKSTGFQEDITVIADFPISKTSEANAKLIASAPKMKNCLKQLRSDLNQLLETVLDGKEVSDTFVQNKINEIDTVLKATE